MRETVKIYVEGCIDIAKLDIKLHKFFEGQGDFLESAESHLKDAETAIEFNMLPAEIKKDEKKLDEKKEV
jgi:hypothetical protein